MSEEKITGVCVDIPTIIQKAKENKSLRDCIPNHWKCDRYVIAPEWISVAERLPEDNCAALWCTSKAGEWSNGEGWTDPGVYYIAEWYQHNGKTYLIDWSSDAEVSIDYFSHWMPLPEPPKAK